MVDSWLPVILQEQEKLNSEQRNNEGGHLHFINKLIPFRPLNMQPLVETGTGTEIEEKKEEENEEKDEQEEEEDQV